MNQAVYYLGTLNSKALKYTNINKHFMPRTLGANIEGIV